MVFGMNEVLDMKERREARFGGSIESDPEPTTRVPLPLEPKRQSTLEEAQELRDRIKKILLVQKVTGRELYRQLKPNVGNYLNFMKRYYTPIYEDVFGEPPTRGRLPKPAAAKSQRGSVKSTRAPAVPQSAPFGEVRASESEKVPVPAMFPSIGREEIVVSSRDGTCRVAPAILGGDRWVVTMNLELNRDKATFLAAQIWGWLYPRP